MPATHRKIPVLDIIQCFNTDKSYVANYTQNHFWVLFESFYTHTDIAPKRTARPTSGAPP